MRFILGLIAVVFALDALWWVASAGIAKNILVRVAVAIFAMAQIAGYALGGCWTHIGSAQSVVAYAFIQRDIDDRYTPIGWIRSACTIAWSSQNPK